MDSGDARETTVVEDDALPINCTELGNARRLVAAYGERLRYCYAWGKWLVWDERRWEIDDRGAAEGLAKHVIRDIIAEALDEEDADRRNLLLRWAISSEQRRTLSASLALAQSEPHVPVRPQELDANSYRLNVLNGTIDLRTGDLHEHDREDRITKLAPVDYDPDATCPLWLAFLDQIFAGDQSVIRFLQRAAGYALTGDTGERVMFVLWGSGGNGKSTLLEVLRAALGDYALRTPTETLLAKKEGGVPNDVARLRGARMVTASETEDGKRFGEAFIKDLTGGDTITARFMRAEWFDFKPECKVFLGTNHKPVIRGTDNAVWDRIRLIPFTVTIPPEQRDKNLRARLMRELPGILSWALRGCLEWQREGLGMPDAVSAATDAYRSEMDVLGAFFEDRCVLGDGMRAAAGELYKAYTDWCEKNGERSVLSQRAFGLRLTERGLQQAKSHGRRDWLGVGLLAGAGADGADGAQFSINSTRASMGNRPNPPHPPPGDSLSAEQIQKPSRNGTSGGAKDHALVCAQPGCEADRVGLRPWCKEHFDAAVARGEV